jgi:predicted ester cyclase
MQSLRTTRRTFTFGLAIAVGFGLSPSLFARASSPSAMTVEQTQMTMQAYADALLGGGPYETFFAEDVVVTLVGAGPDLKGPAAAKQAIDALHHEQFDAKPEVTSLVIGPGQAALEAKFIGTQTGDFAGIPSTGKKVNVPYSVFYELKDGKITALRIYGLVDGLVHQLSPTGAKTGHLNVGPIPPD